MSESAPRNGKNGRRRQAVPVWYHRLPAEAPKPDAWFVTYLDCDRAYR